MDGGLNWIPTQSDIEENGMLLFYDPTEVINLPKDEQKHEENKEESIDNKNEDQNSLNEVKKEIDVNEEEKESVTSPPTSPSVVRPRSGRVFFSFEEIPLHIHFKSEQGTNVQRLSQTEFVIDDKPIAISQLELIAVHKHERKHYALSLDKAAVYVEKFQDLPPEIQKNIQKSGIKLIGQSRRDFGIMLSLYNFLYKNKKEDTIYKIKPTYQELQTNREPKFYDEYVIANHNHLLFKVAEMTVIENDNANKLFKRVQLSGKGGFGRVFFGEMADTHQPVAIKKVSHNTDKEKIQNLKEIGFLTLGAHPNVVKYIQSYKSANELWIVMEFMEGGTLDTALKTHAFTEKETAFIAKELLKGLEFLHYKKMIHRDVTCNNIMLTCQGAVKLIDFGLCGDITKGPRKRMAGTPAYMPPEMIRREEYGTEIDIWSLGVSVMTMAGIPIQFNSLAKLYDVATTGIGDLFDTRFPPTASPLLKQFLLECLTTNSRQRPTASQLLEHPFLTIASSQKEFRKTIEGIFLSNVLRSFGFV